MECHIASRFTYDGKKVCLWADGSITWAFGIYIKGSPRTKDSKALDAAWMFMGDVELYDSDEVEDLLNAAKWAVKRNKGIVGMREKFHARKPMKLEFVTTSSDSRGKPISSVCKLPRMAWPGMAVFKDGSTYSVWKEIGRSGTYEPTGFKFKNRKDLCVYLDDSRNL